MHCQPVSDIMQSLLQMEKTRSAALTHRAVSPRQSSYIGQYLND